MSYLTLLADVRPTFRKIYETKSTSTITCDIPGFEVSMFYSNTMEIMYQLVYLRSVGDIMIR